MIGNSTVHLLRLDESHMWHRVGKVPSHCTTVKGLGCHFHSPQVTLPMKERLYKISQVCRLAAVKSGTKKNKCKMFTFNVYSRHWSEKKMLSQLLLIKQMISVEQPDSTCHETCQKDVLSPCIAGALSYRTSSHKLKSASWVAPSLLWQRRRLSHSTLRLPRGKALAAQEGREFGTTAAKIHTALTLGSTKNMVLLSNSSLMHSRWCV